MTTSENTATKKTAVDRKFDELLDEAQGLQMALLMTVDGALAPAAVIALTETLAIIIGLLPQDIRKAALIEAVCVLTQKEREV
jgi:hypothetical protein